MASSPLRLSSNSGVVMLAPLVAVAAVAVIGYVLVPNWRPQNWFKKPVPVAPVVAAQDELAKEQEAKAKIDAAVAAAVAAEHAKVTDEVRYSQQMATGASAALAKVPSPTPEVVLGQSLLARTNIGLALAIGRLPADQQQEILTIVDQALSKVQAERDAAQAALAAKDAQLRATEKDKQAVLAQIPVLQKQQEALSAKVADAQTSLAAKTKDLENYAVKVAKQDSESGSFKAAIVRLAFILGGLYLAVHVVLPSLAQEFPASKILGWVYKTTKSIFSCH